MHISRCDIFSPMCKRLISHVPKTVIAFVAILCEVICNSLNGLQCIMINMSIVEQYSNALLLERSPSRSWNYRNPHALLYQTCTVSVIQPGALTQNFCSEPLASIDTDIEEMVLSCVDTRSRLHAQVDPDVFHSVSNLCILASVSAVQLYNFLVLFQTSILERHRFV